MQNPKNLNLKETHVFNVSVPSDNGHACYGELILCPEKITLELIYESNGSRKPQFSVIIPKITCKSRNSVFILCDLTLDGYAGTSLDTNGDGLWVSRRKYIVGFVYYSQSGCIEYQTGFNISLISKDLNSWIGRTSNKIKMANEQDLIGTVPELIIELKDNKILSLDYCSHSSYSLDDAEGYFSATPAISLKFNPEPIENIRKHAIDCYELIEFFMGRTWQIDRIEVCFGDGKTYQILSLYIAIKKHRINEADRAANLSLSSQVFIPLGRNIPDTFKTGAPIPDAVFKEYWGNDTNKKFIVSLNKFRDSSAYEDAFLSDFRILEKCVVRSESYFDEDKLSGVIKKLKPELNNCGVKSGTRNDFAKRIIWLNKQKANIENNIVAFLKSIPAQILSHIGVNESLVKSLPKLRNDIAHGNEYEMPEEEFAQKCLQCKIMAYIAVFKKMNFPDQVLAQSLREISIYHPRSPKDMFFHRQFDMHGNFLPEETQIAHETDHMH